MLLLIRNVSKQHVAQLQVPCNLLQGTVLLEKLLISGES